MKSSMKLFQPQTVAALLLATLLPLLSQADTALNRIVAVVNDGVILQNQLDQRSTQIRQQLQEKNTALPPDEILNKQVLERLIVEQIQLQLAQRSSVRIDDALVNANLRQIAASNDMSLTEFRKVLEQDGYQFADFREDIRNQLTIQRLRAQHVESRIQVSDQEIDNLLTGEDAQADNREYLLSHILVAVPEAAAPEQIQAAVRRADAIVQRLGEGADFRQIAVAESDGQKALEGGNLGWRRAGQLPTLFASVVQGLAAGETSSPIRSSSGFHIVRVEQVRGDERHVVTQTQARHILIRPDALVSSEEAHIRLDQLRQRIQGGDDFTTLARAHSQDTVSAARGGDLGWSNPGDMVPRFEEEMARLAPSEISEPFQSRFGWHIVQVLARRDHDSTEEFKRNQARELIRKRKVLEETAIWLRRLRDESYVEYRLGG